MPPCSAAAATASPDAAAVATTSLGPSSPAGSRGGKTPLKQSLTRRNRTTSDEFQSFKSKKREEALGAHLPTIHAVTRDFCRRSVSVPSVVADEAKPHARPRHRSGHVEGLVPQPRQEVIQATRFLETCVALANHLNDRIRQSADELTLLARKSEFPGDGANIVSRLGRQATDTTELEVQILEESKTCLQLSGRLEGMEAQHADLTRELESNQGFVRETSDRLHVAERLVTRQSVQMTESDTKTLALGKQLTTLQINLQFARTFANLRIEDGPALRRSIYLLERENTSSLSSISLARRRVRGWHARAAVLQAQLTKLYMGSVDQTLPESALISLATDLADELRRSETSDHRITLLLEERMGLPVRPPAVKVELYNPRSVLTGRVREEDLTQEEVDFLTHLMATNGERLFEFLSSDTAWSPHIRCRCLQILGREFWHQHMFVRRIEHLVDCVEKLMQITKSDEALAKMSELGQDLLNAEEVMLWVLHPARGILWRYDPAIDDTVHMDIPVKASRKAFLAVKKSADSLGLLLACMYSQQEINLEDDESDARANNTDKQNTERRRSSVLEHLSRRVKTVEGASARLLLPICKQQRDDKPDIVVAIVEARGKDGGFNRDDVYMLKCLGATTLEVLRLCEEADEMDWEEKRTEFVMQTAQELMPTAVDGIQPDVMSILQHGLHTLFNADTLTLQLIYPLAFGRVEAGIDGEQVVRKVKWGGLLAECVKQKKLISVGSDDPGPKYDRESDIDLDEDPEARQAQLHTVPAFWGKTVSSVLQFRCLAPAGRPFGDDGSFNPYSSHHLKLLQQLLVYVMLHVNHKYPMMDRDLDTSVLTKDSKEEPRSSRDASEAGDF